MSATPVRVVVTQSNYVPWRGYFELIASADELVLYDTVQFTKRDWRNRNRIRFGDDIRWLTVPVRVSGRYDQTIAETEIADAGWWRSHSSVIDAAYRDAPAYREIRAELTELYKSLDGMRTLSQVNRRTLVWCFQALGIGTNVHDAASFPHAGDPTARLVQIASQLGATTYVTGPAARAYMEDQQFTDAGMAVEYFDYTVLPEDPDAMAVGAGELSILDLLAREGHGAAAYIPSTRRWRGSGR